MEEYLVLIAVIIDLLVGDPNFLPHPVVIIGKGINWLELGLRKIFSGKLGLKIAGAILSVVVVGSTYLISQLILEIFFGFNYHLGLIVYIWLLSTTIAIKGLVGAGREIYHQLSTAQLKQARKSLGWIVGRDTDLLEAGEIVRGTIETLAENTSDGIIAPLFFGLIGGTPLALAYKAVNTLDSMVAYQNEKYQDFGWAAAKIDDLANLIPARLTGGLFVIAAVFLNKEWKLSLETIIKDAKKHPSPNAGFPEAAIAGALQIRLGGVNYYQGQRSKRAYLGQAKVDFATEQIQDTIKLLYWNTGIFLAGSYLLILVFR
ncbi:adenosylcobinamide-phosphate synthase CbiB [Natroniella sp. ANB-PHB2]|uniref:adenosylcobinamide-phosphate synthase CbiB n=1 Tax=Natroniella sp. ANB-PHB2 TaxID=3384444 RepID=UPI0038D3B884